MKERNPQSVFRKKHLYSFVRETGTFDPAPEEMFGDLEDRGQNIIERLIQEANEDGCFSISREERHTLGSFITNIISRSPDVCYTDKMLREAGCLYQNNVDADRDAGRLSQDNYRDLSSENSVRAASKNILLGALLRPHLRIEAAFERGGVFLISRLNARRYFLVGTGMIVKTLPGDLVANPYEQFLGFPISSDFLAFLGPHRLNGKLLSTRIPGYVDAVNRELFKSSSWLAGRRRNCIDDASSRRILTV